MSTPIFSYEDYRSYLNALLRTKSKRPMSYVRWSKKLGIKSPSTLHMILQGKRNPSEKMAGRIADGLGLSHPEREYFLDLVTLERTQDHHLKTLLLRRIKEAQTGYRSFRNLNEAELDGISDWFAFAIREMAFLKAFKDDPEWISKHLHFPVEPKKIKACLDRLEAKNVLARDPKGTLRPSTGMLDTLASSGSAKLKANHQQQLQNALQSLDAIVHTQRINTGSTLRIRVADLPKILELIYRFKSELLALFDAAEKGEEVYQLEVCFFPLTHSTT